MHTDENTNAMLNKETVNREMGQRIRSLREDMGLSREAFAERCDISPSFLSAIETGQKGLTCYTLYKICSQMNVSADYFLFGKSSSGDNLLVEQLSHLDSELRLHAIHILNELIAVYNKKH